MTAKDLFPKEKTVEPEAIELPVERTLLFIVDMQNDYCMPKGRHYTGTMAGPVILRTKALLERARAAGLRVMYAQTVYAKDDPRFSDHPKAAGKTGCGCKEGTWGAEFVPGLEPAAHEPVVRKQSYDSFFGTGLEATLKRMGFGTFESASVHRNRFTNDCNVIIAGVVSNVCVEKAVIGFYLRGFEVVIPQDCIGAKDDFNQRWSLYQFKNSYKARITESEMLSLKVAQPLTKVRAR